MSDENIKNEDGLQSEETRTEDVDQSRRAALRAMGLAGVAPAVAVVLAPSKGRAYFCASPADGCEPSDDDDEIGTL